MSKGFTLIEVIMIIVLVGIALPAVLIAISQGTRDSYRAELTTVSTHLAQGKMEEITRVKFENHSGFQKMAAVVFPNESSIVNGVEYMIYTNFSTMETGKRKLARVRVAAPGIPDVRLETWFTNYSTLKM